MDEAVAAARAGSESAWRRLVALHENPLVRLAWALTGDRGRAAELAHDALVDAFLGIRGLRNDQAFGSWLRTILVRKARRAVATRPLPETARSPLPSPQDLAMAAELADAADHALATLTPACREALALAMDGQLSSAEAAAALGCSPVAYRVRLHKARGILRGRLARFLQE